MRAGQDGEGAWKFLFLLGGEMYRERGTKPGERKPGSGSVFDAGGLDEVGREWVEFEDVGAVGVGNLGNAESMGSDNAGETAQGVGELMWVFDAAMEELVLRVSWESWDEFEVEFIDWRGGGEIFEVSVEGTEEDVGRKRGLGHCHGAGVAGAVVEGKVEGHLGGGPLMMGKAIAESLEKASGDEENGLMVLYRRLKNVADLEDA